MCKIFNCFELGWNYIWEVGVYGTAGGAAGSMLGHFVETILGMEHGSGLTACLGSLTGSAMTRLYYQLKLDKAEGFREELLHKEVSPVCGAIGVAGVSLGASVLFLNAIRVADISTTVLCINLTGGLVVGSLIYGCVTCPKSNKVICL